MESSHLRIKPVKVAFSPKKNTSSSTTSNKFFSGLLSAIPNPKNITSAIGNEIREISTPRKKKEQHAKNQKQGISFSEWLSFRNPNKSSVSVVSDASAGGGGSGKINDGEEVVDSINLGDFLKQLDSLDKDDSFEDFTKFEMMESLRMCIQCIYMPLFPQININSKTYKLEISNDIDLELLKNTLKITFSNTVSNSEFDKIWKSVDNQYFPQRGKIMRNTNGNDLVKNVIMFRKYLAENDLNPMYYKKIFSKESDYQAWKKDELNQVSVILNTIDQQRSLPFLGTLNFRFNMVTIDLQKAFKSKYHQLFTGYLIYSELSTNHVIYYKISYLKDSKSTQPIVIEADKIDCSKFTMNIKNAIDIEIPESLSHTISTSCEDQDVSIEFYYFQLGGLKKIHFGTTKLRISSLMTQAYNSSGVWGSAQISQTIDLYPYESKSDEVIGCISLCMKATFRRYPCKVDVMTDFSKESRIDWIKLYKFTLKSLIKNREKLPDSDCEDFLCPSQGWILNDFEKRYGITETYKRMLYLEVFASNIKLAITFSDDLQKCLELLDNNLQSKYFPMTQTERNRYFDLTESLLKKIEKAMKQYITMFPKNEPEGALKSFVFVHKLLCCKYNNRINEKEYTKRLKKITNGAFQTHLDGIIEEIQNSLGFKDMNGPILVELCSELVKVFDEIFYFSGIFSIENFEIEAMSFYYSNLEKYINYAKKNDTINGFYMLTLCNKLKPLHEEIRLDFTSKELANANFKFIDPKEISEGYSERYMTELSEMLSKWIKQSIAIDTFEPVNDTCMHSTSVVDYFTSANQIFELLQKLEFTDSNLYVRFAELVIKITTTEYAKKVSDLCLEDIHGLSNQQIDPKQKQSNLLFNMIIPKSIFKDVKDAQILPVAISKKFVIRLNDIEACRQELQSVVKNIFDTSSWAEYEETVEESGFEDFDRDDIDFDEIEKKSNEKSKLIESEYNKKSNVTIQKFSKQFNEVLFDLTLATANIFQAPIRNAISYVLQNAKKDLTKLKFSTRTEVKNLFQGKSDAILDSTLFIPILTPALEILSQNCYKDLFKRILERLFLIVVEELSTLLLDPVNFTKKQQDRVFLTAQQAYVLESILELFIIYFCGSAEKTSNDDEEEESGLSYEFARSKSKLLVKLCQLYNTQTEKLETHLQKLATNTKFAEKYPVKAYHIVSILFTRKKNDEKARKIYSKYKETAKVQRLIIKFNIYARYSIVEGTDKLAVYLTSTCYDSTKFAPGTIHIGGEFLLFEFRFSNVYHRISLRDIERIQLTEGFMRKGVSIHFKVSSNTAVYVGSSSNNPKNGVKFYFSDESSRSSLLDCLQTQFKNLGTVENVVISKNKPATAVAPSKFKNFFKFGSKPSSEQTKNFLASASESSDSLADSADEETREDTIKTKFDIPMEEKCITFFSSNIRKDENTTFKSSIFVFTSSFCFYAIQSTFYEKFTWNRIEKIVQNATNLKISIKDYGEIEICELDNEHFETFMDQYKYSRSTQKIPEQKNEDISLFSPEEAQAYFFNRFQIDKICSKEKLITYFFLSNSQEPTGIAFVGEQYFCFEWMKPQKKDTIIQFTSIKSLKKTLPPENQDSHLLGTISISTSHDLTYELPVIQTKLEFDSLFNLLRSKVRRNQTESFNPFSMVSSVIGNVGSTLLNTAKAII